MGPRAFMDHKSSEDSLFCKLGCAESPSLLQSTIFGQKEMAGSFEVLLVFPVMIMFGRADGWSPGDSGSWFFPDLYKIHG
ncbi:hypothetical protein F0562_009301 [Nyssa sinensis]|uniref:Uncharacterized protein n=1 Tax=Nyssa sinensis TaxID=561372 RepID=A0A5J4ZYR6_9ASTE|nr:hypothetical protein F0562_009301 [Nyssa sinensis]